MRLRFSFDAGAGVCLWAMDAEAKASFGYPVDAAALGVSAELAADIEALIEAYDAAFDWNDPGNQTKAWTAADLEIRTRALSMLERLRAELGQGFTIDNGFDG
jgi:hypothetical protein